MTLSYKISWKNSNCVKLITAHNTTHSRIKCLKCFHICLWSNLFCLFLRTFFKVKFKLANRILSCIPKRFRLPLLNTGMITISNNVIVYINLWAIKTKNVYIIQSNLFSLSKITTGSNLCSFTMMYCLLDCFIIQLVALKYNHYK